MHYTPFFTEKKYAEKLSKVNGMGIADIKYTITIANLKAGEAIIRRRGVVLTAEGADLQRDQNKIKTFGIFSSVSVKK